MVRSHRLASPRPAVPPRRPESGLCCGPAPSKPAWHPRGNRGKHLVPDQARRSQGPRQDCWSRQELVLRATGLNSEEKPQLRRLRVTTASSLHPTHHTNFTSGGGARLTAPRTETSSVCRLVDSQQGAARAPAALWGEGRFTPPAPPLCLAAPPPRLYLAAGRAARSSRTALSAEKRTAIATAAQICGSGDKSQLCYALHFTASSCQKHFNSGLLKLPWSPRLSQAQAMQIPPRVRFVALCKLVFRGKMKQTEFNKETSNRMAAGFTFTSTALKTSMGLAGLLTVGEAAAEGRVPVIAARQLCLGPS